MNCTYCNAEKSEINRLSYSTSIGKMTLVSLSCGHAFNLNKKVYQSSDGRVLYPFQEVGIDFLNADIRTGRGKLLADEQGLGKTIQATGYLDENPERLPALIITKSKLTRQWMSEIYRWNNAYSFLISGKGIIKGFKYYIVSVDLLRNLDRNEIKRLGIKTIVIDECQSIKNSDSQRSQSVTEIAGATGECKCGHNWRNHNQELELSYDSSRYNKPTDCTYCDCKMYTDTCDVQIIGLSGTPILNRASEFYPILHLIDPVRFRSESTFKYEWIDTWSDGYKTKEGGIINPKRWREFTKDIILRRERAEVMPDLPSIDRQIRWVDLQKVAQDEYDKQERGFIEEYIKNQLEGVNGTMHLLAYITKMRHIIGLSKVPDCIDYVTDFLLSTNRKICIFVHHQDVALILTQELNKWLADGGMKPCLQIKGNMLPDPLSDIQKKFNEDMGYKVLIASTLAAGEGLNLQEQCGDCVILERQWNPPKEEQAISRFVRIGFMNGCEVKLNSVIAQYILAISTIDDWMVQIIEEKRAIFEQAVNAKEVEAAEMELMKALMEKIVLEGRKKWKLT